MAETGPVRSAVHHHVRGGVIMTIGDTWYRYVDNDSEWNREPYEIKLTVVRYTPKCVVLLGYGATRYVLLEPGRKRYAHPTRELALASYIVRKSMEARIMAARHDRAMGYLNAAKAFRDRGLVPEPYGSPASWMSP